MTKRTSKLQPGDVVKVEGKGKQLFTLEDEYQYRTVDGWYARDEEGRHRVFPTSLIKS